MPSDDRTGLPKLVGRENVCIFGTCFPLQTTFTFAQREKTDPSKVVKPDLVSMTHCCWMNNPLNLLTRQRDEEVIK